MPRRRTVAAAGRTACHCIGDGGGVSVGGGGGVGVGVGGGGGGVGGDGGGGNGGETTLPCAEVVLGQAVEAERVVTERLEQAARQGHLDRLTERPT